ncbi:MAG: acyl-CoA dehydrogenase family protein [Chloroflexi bacterium]|nr:acyl-CoA dehydrogenase family protein [Chloroflexota bacterium]
MDFSLTEEQQLLRKTAREWAAREIGPHVQEWDRTEEYPFDVIRKVGQMGWTGGIVPEKYGGAGMDFTTMTVLADAVGYVWDQLPGMVFGASSSRGYRVLLYGTEEQKMKYLAPLARGEAVACNALTEPRSGSDVAGMTTTARREGDVYVINGQKAWNSNLRHAAWICTFAQMDKSKGRHGITAFIVDANAPGLSKHLYHNKVGMRNSDSGDVILQDVRVPVEDRLGAEGEGFRVAMAGSELGRLGAAGDAIGELERCMDESIKYAQSRIVFGQPIGRYQLVQSKITDMVVNLEAGRFLTYRYCWLKDQGVQRARVEVAMAKLFTSDALMKGAIDACQIHGAYSCSDEYEVGRIFRNAKFRQIVDGTNEIQRVLIAEYMLGYRSDPPELTAAGLKLAVL